MWALASLNDEVLPESTDPGSLIRYIEISDVNEVQGITGLTEIAFGDSPSRARRRVRQGDVILSTVRTYLRAVAAIDLEHAGCVVSTGFAVIRPRKIDSGYLKHIAASDLFIEEVIARSVGVSYPAINASDLMKLKVPVPPLEEQQQIAAFLDYETRRTNDLIQEQLHLRDLLAEKHRATIQHAVTKGLAISGEGLAVTRHPPMGWTRKPFKLIARIRNGRDYKEVEVPDGPYPVIGSGGEFARASSYLYDGESVLLGRKGTIDKPLHVKGRFWTVDTMFYTEILPGNSPKYAYYLATTLPFNALATRTALPSMTQEALGNVQVIVPGFDEQCSIAAFLDTETQRVNELQAEQDKSIALLLERRSALITAAVTGQIDVRDWRPPEPGEEELQGVV